MKRRTKAEKFQDHFEAFKCVRDDKPVKRAKAKDGSIPTHPVVSVPDLPESEVLKQCLSWLRMRRIFCTRHDCGAGDFGHGYVTYGIKDAGDIIGLLPTGQHFEIECKKGEGGRLSKGQQKRMQRIQENNGLYFVIHGILELKHYMREIVE